MKKRVLLLVIKSLAPLIATGTPSEQLPQKIHRSNKGPSSFRASLKKPFDVRDL